MAEENSEDVDYLGSPLWHDPNLPGKRHLPKKLSIFRLVIGPN